VVEQRAIDGAVQLAAEVAGSGHPLVGLHGLTATRRYVLLGSRALERRGYEVVLYDARGHGDSAAPPDGDYSYEALSHDLGHVLDAFGFERALLVGASMGAHTALRFALERPERVAGLVLITPAYDPDEAESQLPRWDALSHALRTGGIPAFLDAFDVSALAPRWRELVRTVISQRLALHQSLEAVADALSAVPRSRPFEDFAELSAIALPTLVVANRDDSDPEHPLATAQRYAAALPDAELLVEEPGRPPIAWQGGQLSRAIATLGERAWAS
jgi:pimeloyl-ACP methyl ester carboxylesterase